MLGVYIFAIAGRFIYILLRAANIITQAVFPQEMWVNVTCDDALLDVCHHIEFCFLQKGHAKGLVLKSVYSKIVHV